MSINNTEQERINIELSKEYDFDNFNELADKYYKRYTNNSDIYNLPTPCYFIDEWLLDENICSIKSSFYNYFSQEQLYIFYPIKINNHKFILKKMIQYWIWLEVASREEYKLVLSLKSEKILYYAPWKTMDDLIYFVKNSNENHTIHIDSFCELEKLKDILKVEKKRINIWVRIYTSAFWNWQKYWINIIQLKEFIDNASESEFINFCWIHFHTSRNIDSHIYVDTLNEIAHYFSNIESKYISRIKYIDFWWWFEKSNIEWTYFKWTQKFQLLNILWRTYNEFWDEIIPLKSYNLDRYIWDIYSCIQEKLFPIFWMNIKFYTEPWRIFVSDIMHILTKVVDVKNDTKNMVIVDAGVNMIWWQRAEFEYFPVINLSSAAEIMNQKAIIYWNLCTTWDHWGYYCYTQRKLKEKDFILLSNQGTLSYSLAQKFFINKLPEVFILYNKIKI